MEAIRILLVVVVINTTYIILFYIYQQYPSDNYYHYTIKAKNFRYSKGLGETKFLLAKVGFQASHQ